MLMIAALSMLDVYYFVGRHILGHRIVVETSTIVRVHTRFGCMSVDFDSDFGCCITRVNTTKDSCG